MPKEYIERKEALLSVNEFYHDPKVDIVLRRIPAADVVEVVHGKWITGGVGITERIICSVCKSDKGSFMKPPFCNQCGAKMDGERRD